MQPQKVTLLYPEGLVFSEQICFFLLATWYLSNLLCRAVLLGLAIYPDPDSFKHERFINSDVSVRDGPVLAVAFWMRKADLPW